MNDAQNQLEILRQEVETLRQQLAEVQERLDLAEETLQAISSGEVDAVVISTQEGEKIFTLEGADHVYQCLVEQMGEGAGTISSDGLILYCNQRLSELINFPAKNLIGSKLENFISPRDRQTFLLLLEQLPDQEIITKELSLITAKENQEIPVKLSLKQFNTDQYLMNSIIITDITEAKVREAAKLNQVLNRAIATIVNYRAFPNHTWSFDYLSEGCEILCGYTATELIADQNLWASRVDPEDFQGIIAQTFDDFQQNKSSSNIEYRFLHKNGTVRWFAADQFPQWDETNNYWVVNSILTDITRRKQAEIAQQEQIARERLVTNITQNIRQTLDLNQILETTVEQIQELLKAERVLIYHFNPDGDGTVIAESLTDGFTSLLSQTLHDECCTQHYFSFSQADFYARTDIFELEPCLYEFFESFQVKASLTVPITHARQLWGYLIVHQCSTTRQWQPAEIELIKQLATQVSIAIQQSELYQQAYQELQERKKAQESLYISEQRLKALMEYAPAVIFILDLDNRLMLVSRGYEELTGMTAENLIGKSIYEIWTKQQADAFTKINRQIIENPQVIGIEEIVPEPDGHTYFTLKFPLYDQEGKVYAVGGISTDINEAKEAQRKIAEQAALINIATDAIFVQDLENRILFWNQGAERLYGWTAAEVLGQKTQTLFNQENELTEALQTTIGQKSWQGELEQITKTGKKIIVESRMTLVENKFSQSKSILIVNSDITEKKQLEKQFYHAQRLESLGTLASGIAHDFNNILTPILSINQLLPLKFPNIDEQTKRLLTILSNSASRGANLVKQILLFSRETEGEPVILQLGDLVLELIGIIKQTFPKSITISTHIPTASLWTISSDPTQIHQVFLNLMINARDAMLEGGTLTISAENRQLDQHYALMNWEAKSGPYVMVTVADTGIGIPPELLERIFDPFFTTKDVGKGTGLGLATVMGIVKNNGGFIKVYSELGKGTEFKVFLPAMEGEVSLTSSNETTPRGKGELVLIVDDEDLIREVTKTALKNYNYRVIVARDGIEAIKIYDENQQEISVILMDMMMPNLDSVTTISSLQKINPQVKIIATSGLSANRKLALDVNVQTFLLKPYTIRQLLQILKAVLSPDDEQQNNIPSPIPEAAYPRSTVELSKDTFLAIMPPEWLQQMYDAAYYCDEDVLLELIAQIPDSQQAIANTLKDLVMDFNTDLIMKFTK